jgi:hypothetical protein
MIKTYDTGVGASEAGGIRGRGHQWQFNAAHAKAGASTQWQGRSTGGWENAKASIGNAGGANVLGNECQQRE